MPAKARINPLRADPSRTATIQRKFLREINQRFTVFKKSLDRLIAVEDAFGLKPPSTMSVNVAVDTSKGFIKSTVLVSRLMSMLDKGTLKHGNETDPRRVARKVKTGILNEVVILTKSGKAIIKDGNHSLKAAIERGDKSIKVAVQNPLTANARFSFNTDAQKLEEFRKWLAQRSQDLILSDPNTTKDDWWAKYSEEAYKQGQGRAFDDTKKPYARGYAADGSTNDFYKGTKYEFLSSSFNQPETIEKIQLLSGRTFSELKGMTDGMAQVLTRDLADGLARGDNPRDIARNLTKSLDISQRRAETIARTEIIRAHAEGALDAMEKMGVEEVGVMVEWSSTDDSRVCPLCRPLDGIVLKLSEARGMFPRHPNCRCSPIPAGVGEKSAKQKKSQQAVQDAINDSIEAEIPAKAKDRKLSEQKDLSKWQGADAKIAKERPRSVLDGPLKPPKGQVKEKPQPVPLAPVVPAYKPPTKIPGTPLGEKLKHPELDGLRLGMLKRNKDVDTEINNLAEETYQAKKKGCEIGKQQKELYENRHSMTQKEYNEKNAELEKLYGKWEQLQTRKYLEYKALQSKQKQKLHETLDIKDDSRKLKIEVKTAQPISTRNSAQKPIITERQSGEHKQKMDDAQKFLGNMTDSNGVPKLEILGHQMSAGERAFHRAGNGFDAGVFLTKNDGVEVYIHEIAHRIERENPEILAKAIEFREMRIARSGTKAVSMKDTFPNHGYADHEMGNKDEFDKAFDTNSAHYVGKSYKDSAGERSTEVITMGVQKIYEDPIGFAEKDPEYFNFIVGVLRGVL